MRNWIVGLLVSVVVGGFCTWLLLYFLRKRTGEQQGKPSSHIPGWVTGVIERTFFTIVIGNVGAAGLGSIAAAMIGWLGIKLATNWNRPGLPGDVRPGAFRALLAGLVSMFFALLGGLIVIL